MLTPNRPARSETSDRQSAGGDPAERRSGFHEGTKARRFARGATGRRRRRETPSRVGSGHTPHETATLSVAVSRDNHRDAHRSIHARTHTPHTNTPSFGVPSRIRPRVTTPGEPRGAPTPLAREVVSGDRRRSAAPVRPQFHRRHTQQKKNKKTKKRIFYTLSDILPSFL